MEVLRNALFIYACYAFGSALPGIHRAVTHTVDRAIHGASELAASVTQPDAPEQRCDATGCHWVRR
jgi:hypothetical protein